MAGLLANGSVPTTLADTALKHLFKVQMRLGMFDEADAQPPWAKCGPLHNGSVAHLPVSARFRSKFIGVLAAICVRPFV